MKEIWVELGVCVGQNLASVRGANESGASGPSSQARLKTRLKCEQGCAKQPRSRAYTATSTLEVRDGMGCLAL